MKLMTNIYVPLVMVIAQADCFASFLMEIEYNLKTNEIV